MYQQLMITPEPFAYSEFEGFGPDQEVGGPPVGAGRNSPAYIRWVQQSLNQVMGLRLAEDGIMGPATRSAIRSFQQKQGLVADGTVGSKTQMALMPALGIISTPASFSPPGEPSKLTQQTVYGWSQYRQRVEDLPLEQKAILKSIGDAIIASEQQGRPVRTVQVYGHADQDTPPNQQREQQMSDERAKQVTNWLKAYVGGPIAAQIAWDIRGFGSTQLKKPPTTEENRRQNRCVEIRLWAPEPIVIPDVVITPSCDPPYVKATSIEDYISLVSCVEAALPDFTPRMILSLLRQTYYGNESWTRQGNRNRLWSIIIPCGHKLSDPRPRLGGGLFGALQASQVVSGNEANISIDMGNVFTGLEAMCCPVPTVDLIPGIARVAMPNEEVATAGGDLGSAAAQKFHDENDLGQRKPWTVYFGGTNTLSNNSDLEGDIDTFVLRVALLKSNLCRNTALRGITAINISVSQLLEDYYSTATTAAGNLRRSRYRCFSEILGGNVAGKRIINRSNLEGPISDRVCSFAVPFYYFSFRRVVGIPIPPLGSIGPGLLRNSIEIKAAFLHS